MMFSSKSQRNSRAIPVAIVAMTVALASVALVTRAGATSGYAPKLTAATAPAEKVTTGEAFAPLTLAAPKAVTPLATTAAAPTAAARVSAAKVVRTRTAQTTARTATRTSAPAATGSELDQARAILAGLIAQHPILAGVTVEFGDAHGYQAISYYQSGRIVISSTHSVSLSRILNHEVWHIIDWRDNGRIDWGENVPPR